MSWGQSPGHACSRHVRGPTPRRRRHAPPRAWPKGPRPGDCPPDTPRSDGPGDELLAGEEALEAAHAPVRVAVLGEQSRDAADAGGLRLAADLADPLEALRRISGRDD